MEPQPQREAEKEAGRKLHDQWMERWDEHQAAKHPLTREVKIEAITELLIILWGARFRPAMYMGSVNHQIVHIWLCGVRFGINCAGVELDRSLKDQVDERRTGRGFSAYCAADWLHLRGFDEATIVDTVLSMEIETWEAQLKIWNDDRTWSLETLRQTLCRFPGASREYPFGATAGVYKVGGKMFALVAEDADPLTINLKCEPERAEELRLTYPCVTPGYHMNKRHWNTVTLDSSVEITEVWEWMQHSYDLVFDRLTRAQREQVLTPQ